MTKATIAVKAFVTVLALVVLLVLALVVRFPALERNLEPAGGAAATFGTSPPPAGPEMEPGFLYGRITTVDGATFEGRLRWGGDQEAFWGDYFNGAKAGNRWVEHTRREPVAKDGGPIEIFGFRIGGPDGSSRFNRLFMARFGDITRIEAHVSDVQVTLKSGTVVELDRFDASDIDDGVRVWDHKRGVVDLDARRIRTIEFLPTAPLSAAPGRLHGKVRTRLGDFTGFIQWDRQDCTSVDTLDGRTDGGELSLAYENIRSIARYSRDSVLVTLVDGSEKVLSGTREVGRENRGIYVDDVRYGRVLISWDAFELVEFSPAGSGPAYGDFAPGRALAGSVTARDGRQFAGRLVYDLDESETTETLDARSQGVDYTVPFGLIRSIVPPGRDGAGTSNARVVLEDGEEVQFERSGDLTDGNAGLLIFIEGREHPEYVPWSDVEKIDLYPAPGSSR